MNAQSGDNSQTSSVLVKNGLQMKANFEFKML